ncbi:hypothetical protein H2203_008542 [Taxawa tesnikishii (nom. ined.)]|nr:hypothetical protein H2203_008542 [Dothideales sp. JES 119]
MSGQEYYNGGGHYQQPPQHSYDQQGQYGAPPPQGYPPQDAYGGQHYHQQAQYQQPQHHYQSDQYQQTPYPQSNDPYQQNPHYDTHSPVPSYNNQQHQGYAPPPLSAGYDQPGYSQGAPSYSDHHQKNDYRDQGPGGAEGERGLGATLIGGAGGAFLGHELGGGALGTIGGLIAGAIGANALENRHEKKKKEKKHKKRDSDYSGLVYGSSAAMGAPQAPLEISQQKQAEQ